MDSPQGKSPEAPAKPEGDSVNPESATKPEEAPVKPEEAPVKSEEAPAKPGEGAAKTGEGTAKPDESASQPAEGAAGQASAEKGGLDLYEIAYQMKKSPPCRLYTDYRGYCKDKNRKAVIVRRFNPILFTKNSNILSDSGRHYTFEPETDERNTSEIMWTRINQDSLIEVYDRCKKFGKFKWAQDVLSGEDLFKDKNIIILEDIVRLQTIHMDRSTIIWFLMDGLHALNVAHTEGYCHQNIVPESISWYRESREDAGTKINRIKICNWCFAITKKEFEEQIKDDNQEGRSEIKHNNWFYPSRKEFHVSVSKSDWLEFQKRDVCMLARCLLYFGNRSGISDLSSDRHVELSKYFDTEVVIRLGPIATTIDDMLRLELSANKALDLLTKNLQEAIH